MTLYFLIVFGFYSVLLLVLRFGWEKAVHPKDKAQAKEDFFISIIIPVRNEEKNIESLIDSLSHINYPAPNFEVIIVDDHSTDDSVKLAENGKDSLRNLTVVSLSEKFGKKAALTRGIHLAKGKIIATTDADCWLKPNWLMAINSIFQDEKIKMAAGMVTIAPEKKLFSQWQAMEFASVMGTGAAAFGLNKPFLCNGANLSFRKEVFYEVNGYEGNEHIASGDDEFLMRKIVGKHPDSVRLLSTPDVLVVTQPQLTVNDFLQQRLRWASKWKANPLVSAKLLAVFILFFQASWILVWLYFFIDNYKVALFLSLLKIVSDLIFLLPVFTFMKIKFRILPFFGLQFLYPFYVLLVGVFSQFHRYRWKERKINT